MPGLKKSLRRKEVEPPEPIVIPRYQPDITPPPAPPKKKHTFTKVNIGPEGSFWRIKTTVEEMDEQLANEGNPFFLLVAINDGAVRMNKRYVRSYYTAVEEVPDA